MIHPRLLPPGTVVTVSISVGLLTITHPGLVSDRLGPDGLPTVISASKRRARRHVEEAWSSFTEGKRAAVKQMASNVGVAEMLRRARADIGKPWDLTTSNCEHAIARWRGLPVTSPQLRVGVTLGICAFALLALLFVGRR